MNRLRSSFFVAALLAGSVAGYAADAALPSYTEGQAVEVREGDTWSKATVVKKEGRKIQIRYEGAGSTEEWVTSDRIRLPGAAGSPAPKAEARPVAKPAAQKWKIGDKVELKWGAMWRKASVKNIRGEWYLIQMEPGNFLDWAEPWRIRAVGSTEDNVGYATPHSVSKASEPPPSEKPGPAPEATGSGRNRAFGSTDVDVAKAAVKDDPAYKAITWAGVKSVPLKAVGWSFTPDPIAPTPTAQAAIPLTEKPEARHAHLSHIYGERFIVAAGAPAALVARGGTRMSHKELQAEKIDLAARRSVTTARFGNEISLLDFSPDGKTVALRSELFGSGGQERLEVWNLEGPAKTLVTVPYDGEDTWGRDVTWAQFADPTRLLISNGGRTKGKVGLIDVTTGKVVWQADTSTRANPAMSPGRKYVILEADKNAVIVETLTGKVVGELDLDGFQGATWAFSPSCKQVAAISGKSIRVWDLATGKVDREFAIPVGGRAFQVPVEGYGLVDNTYLVDFDKRILLWKYDGATSIAPAGGNRVWTVHASSGSLINVPMPGPDVLAAAAAVKPEEMMLLRPGVKVALQFNAGGNDAQSVQESLKKSITEAGLVLDDAAPIRFVVTTETGKSQEVEYTPFHGPRFQRGQKVTVTPQITRMKIEFEGKTAWETSTTVTPGIGVVHLKEGQSLEQNIAEQSKPNLTFLKHVRIPRYLQKPKEQPWLGTSALAR